ncbi:MAG: hypothetical protein IJT00_08155 [Lachnospiraceae bacterium]|nr:hypothetical protein [Lachnospiraceae bacterium]
MVLALPCAGTVYGAEWRSDSRGSWWVRDDGTYPQAGWEEIDGKWYYFDEEGYLVTNRFVDIGYYVGADGAWMPEQDAVVYNHNVSAVYETPCLEMHFHTAKRYGDFWQVRGTLYAWYDQNGPIAEAPLYDVTMRVRTNAEIAGWSSADAFFRYWTGETAGTAAEEGGRHLIHIRQDRKGYVTNAEAIR